MTYDKATYTIGVDTVGVRPEIPLQESESIGVEVEEWDTDGDQETVTVVVEGDSNVIPLFEQELSELEEYEIQECDVEIGAGEPQPEDIRLASE